MLSSLNLRNISLIFILFISTQVYGVDDAVRIEPKKLEILRTEDEIKIDGQLRDIGWNNAVRVSDFVENDPGYNIDPPVKTEAILSYDDNNLYVAFIVWDNPDNIRVSLTERDRTYNDDRVGILIDSYGDASWAYEFFVNPYGIQMDKLFSQQAGEDDSYDLIWESAGKITDSGYQVEMAIPFSSIRFPNQAEQTWRIELWNNFPRETRHKISWNAYSKEETCWPCQWGYLYGIKDVTPGKGIAIMPSTIGYQSGEIVGVNQDTSKTIFDNHDPDGEFSFDAKYSITSNITADLTVNPDFSQIEADASQFDVNSISALYYPERRPFFQEGSDLFSSIFDIVYTRMINDPLVAGKLIGRLNRTNIGYIFAYDENSPIPVLWKDGNRFFFGGESFSNIFRLRRTFGENSRVGLMVTNRIHKDDGSASVMGIDGSIRLSSKNDFHFHAIGTYTEEADTSDVNGEIQRLNDYGFIDSTFDKGKYTTLLDGESFWGHALYTGISHESRNLYLILSYLETTPTYRPDLGFRNLNSQRGPHFTGLYHFRIENNKILERISPTIELGREWNFDGDRRFDFVHLSVEIMFKAQTSTHNEYSREKRLYKGKWYDNIFLWHTCFHSIFSDRINFGGSINYGNQIARIYETVGREKSYNLWVDIKPIDRLLQETSMTFIKSDRLDEEMTADTTGTLEKELYKDFIFRSRTSLQINRELSLRMVVEYVDSDKSCSIDPLITYRLNPFTVFYAGSSYNYQEIELKNGFDENLYDKWHLSNRQFFIKFRYLFQI